MSHGANLGDNNLKTYLRLHSCVRMAVNVKSQCYLAVSKSTAMYNIAKAIKKLIG